jgi:hypothetical protein
MSRPVTQYSRLLAHNAGWYKAKVRKLDSRGHQLSYTEYEDEGDRSLTSVIKLVVNQIREAPGEDMDSEECASRLARLMDDLNFRLIVHDDGDVIVSAEFICEPSDRYYSIEIFGQESQ